MSVPNVELHLKQDERAVLQGLMQGIPSEEIAQKLQLQESEVKELQRRVRAKLALARRQPVKAFLGAVGL